ncbi:hypothetical protein GLOTRDRAFT_134119 [Gloeophyllum trabeum ATCC 11539]|uniref:SH3 domain-containing protein n=1 Tax=Gloeophyllum trabeum (strain ATCC 11539 / FP-39264 / Madison 617) TaxID=670483 RepID=S7PS78_GLOTA|nr:uncharacterized protein GLOTRDRAFT_134119 [Gloeophyllum trabeum ATCC 11539]EPQ50248.1 hypothetical protein GLOTRDRAFT_134119 [Gloeophyllum trabeum ATCC 11539]
MEPSAPPNQPLSHASNSNKPRRTVDKWMALARAKLLAGILRRKVRDASSRREARSNDLSTMQRRMSMVDAWLNNQPASHSNGPQSSTPIPSRLQPSSSNSSTNSECTVRGHQEQWPYRPARARYSFDGSGPDELRLRADQLVHVLDDRDGSWWYALDPATGAEGVVPAAYLC